MDMGGVEVWRGGLGKVYRLPALSYAGASLTLPCLSLRQSLDFLSVGLSPTGIGASFAAPDPHEPQFNENAGHRFGTYSVQLRSRKNIRFASKRRQRNNPAAQSSDLRVQKTRPRAHAAENQPYLR
jgi:hypothetical protein